MEAHGNDPRLSELVDHKTTGLQHLIMMSRKSVDDLRKRLETVNQELDAVLSNFRRLAHVHDLKERFLPGYESRTWIDEEQTRKAKLNRFSCFACGAAAVIFGAYFSITTLVASSKSLLFLGSLAVAFILGVAGYVVLEAITKPSPDNPTAIKRLDVAIILFGTLFLASCAVFGWSRFFSGDISDVQLGALIVSIELSAVMLAAALNGGFQVFRWSRDFDEKAKRLKAERIQLENKLAEENMMLQGLQYRSEGVGQRTDAGNPDEIAGMQ